MTDKQIKVLLIEDNPGDARLIQEMLSEVKGAPFYSECAGRLATGLERLTAGGIDLVLLDLGLPDSSGLETFLRAHAQSQQVPLIVLSGLDDEMLAVDAVRRGAQDYIVKGQVDSNLLGRAMRYALERKKAEDALRVSEKKYSEFFKTSRDVVFITSKEGRLIEYNDALVECFGYETRDELLKMRIQEQYENPEEWKRFNNIIEQQGFAKEFPVNLRTKDGSIINTLITSVALKDKNGSVCGYQGTIRNITEQKHAEDTIKKSLKEKEVLLREIHHRVKNNLQVVSSLLNMQARTINDKKTLEILSESRNRINAMALIHSQLYESENLSAINMKGFVDKLLYQLFQSYRVHDTRITPVVHADNCSLPISIAVPVGLIVNELLSNAFKHAFVNRKEGKLEVSLRASEKSKMALTVSDDGVGLPSGFDINASKTLGLRMVKILVEDQLQGNLEVISKEGTTFRIEFEIEDN